MYARLYEERRIYRVLRKENRRREEKLARKEVLLEQ
jgi:hypothetical protein